MGNHFELNRSVRIYIRMIDFADEILFHYDGNSYYQGRS